MLFEHLTGPAKQVLVRATEAAKEMGSQEVEGAHLVLGFLDAPGTTGPFSKHLPDRARVALETKRLTMPSRDGAQPGFSREVALILAAARGISVGRGVEPVGSANCLLAMLTLLPYSVEELFAALRVDANELRAAAARLDDKEPVIDSGPGEHWTATVEWHGPEWDDDQ